MIVNSVEMENLELFEVEIAERYEKALKLLETTEIKTEGLTMAQGIKVQCEIIFEFFDIMYGEGASKKIFGNKVNLVTCLNALGDFMTQINKNNTDTLNSINKKYSSNRAKRR